jgi:hypothetical protein
MPLATIEKSPYATLSYSVDWTAWLSAGDTIDTVTWTVPAGLTNVQESNTATKASIKLSGGTAGQQYDVRCQIETVGGLIDARTLRFMVVDR